MAARKKKDTGSAIGTLIGILILIGFILGSFALLLWPLYFVFRYIYLFWKNANVLLAKPHGKDFWLEPDEISAFIETHQEWQEASKKAQKELAIFDELPDAHTNKDGSFDERRPAGRDRNKQWSVVLQANSKEHGYQRDLEEFYEIPQLRWQYWKSIVSTHHAIRSTLVMMIIIFPISISIVALIHGESITQGFVMYYWNAFVFPFSIMDG